MALEFDLIRIGHEGQTVFACACLFTGGELFNAHDFIVEFDDEQPMGTNVFNGIVPHFECLLLGVFHRVYSISYAIDKIKRLFIC